jgi:hypothetical protein
MTPSSLRYVGWDVHHESITVASVAQDHGAAVVALGTIGPRQGDLDQRRRPLDSQAKPRVCGDATGPCGSWRYRDRPKTGHDGGVVAPACRPNTAGDRVNTDRREARPRARLRRSGDLTPVDVPQVDDDALRDRRRARDDRLRALNAATSRRNAVRLRQDRRDTGPAHGSPAPLRGRAAVVGPTPAPHLVCPASVRAVIEPTARLQRLAQARQERGNTWRLAPVVAALQALRGVQCTGAVPTGAARGDRTRVTHPTPWRRDLGLTPSAYARGHRRSQGGLTTTGHRQARRALLAGAWASRDPAQVSRPLHLRRAQRPPPLQDLRWQAQVRWCQWDRPRMARGQHATHVVVAMARALVPTFRTSLCH